MTKVVRKIVKCDKCGFESPQVFVRSVNFSLGSSKDNKKLMKHKQKCPNCGYEATLICKKN